MARDEEDDRKRRRAREDERDEEELRQKEARSMGTESTNEVVENKFEFLLERAESMIDQVNTLYKMYFSGVEKIPPLEKRKQLDQVMVSLQAISKPTLGSLFRYNGIQSRYNLHVERWNKLMKDLEDGKIKRKLGISR